VSKAEEEEEASLLAERKVEPKDLEEEFIIFENFC
jgi:hypothetical protein